MQSLRYFQTLKIKMSCTHRHVSSLGHLRVFTYIATALARSIQQLGGIQTVASIGMLATLKNLAYLGHPGKGAVIWKEQIKTVLDTRKLQSLKVTCQLKIAKEMTQGWDCSVVKAIIPTALASSQPQQLHIGAKTFLSKLSHLQIIIWMPNFKFCSRQISLCILYPDMYLCLY